jgi:hypothetical protein
MHTLVSKFIKTADLVTCLVRSSCSCVTNEKQPCANVNHHGQYTSMIHNKTDDVKTRKPFPGVATSRSSPTAKSMAFDAKSGL